MIPLIRENQSLKRSNTFAIDVNAKYFAEINSIADLSALLAGQEIQTEALLIVGGGSNILFTKDFEGLVIKMNIQGITVTESGAEVFVTAGAGVNWHELVQFCVAHGFAGIENLSLIPGTVGASPIQNIGAYGVELKDVFYSCEAMEIATGDTRTFHYEDCHFGYRESVFKSALKGKYIITSVCYRLSKVAHLNTQYGAITAELERRNILEPTIADVSAVVADIRVSKLPDPSTIGNAGSFFKNPVIDAEEFAPVLAAFPEVVHYPAGPDQVKVAAGWLIESCGFKGMVSGNTGTWKNQALVLVNHGGATGAEVYNFSETIIETVQAKFGIRLEREVNIL
ncbi:MAG: UDP-N-acetylmuramate dehydrogenase [Chryseobacterium sp.]|nr:MAG: UDP-N-acetylmuramate dehydrogenase [Chryseobacterium sp.]